MNSSVAQWDHRSVDGTLKGASVALYKPPTAAEKKGSLKG